MKKIVAALLIIFTLFEAFPYASAGDAYPFTVYFLDVGQGDCAIVVADGEAMIIDGGDRDQSNKVYAFLNEIGVSSLKYMFASHPDADHIGGLMGALNCVPVENIYCIANEDESTVYADFQREAAEKNCRIEFLSADDGPFSLGGAKIDILMPPDDTVQEGNYSLVLRVVYGGVSFLFTGDCDAEEESILLSSGQNVQSTVLKVAHHGSGTSTTTEFLDAVSPTFAIISTDGNNNYGHPSPGVLAALRTRQITVYRTDMHGLVTCSSDGSDLYVTPERNIYGDAYSYSGGYDNTLESTFSPQSETNPDCTYIVNLNNGKYHLPTCSSVEQMKEENKWPVTCSAEELEAQGYEPCGRCHPDRK